MFIILCDMILYRPQDLGQYPSTGVRHLGPELSNPSQLLTVLVLPFPGSLISAL